jgi:hypothetical protein
MGHGNTCSKEYKLVSGNNQDENLFSFILFLMLIICLLPLFLPNQFSISTNAGYHRIFKIMLLSIPILTIFICYSIKIGVSFNQKMGLFVLLIGLAFLLKDLHYTTVDITDNIFKTISNHQWQVEVHDKILKLSPDVIPHSYRFLPNSITRIFEALTGDFSYARALYRYTFMFLLLFSIYFYARLYCNHEKSLLVILLYSMVYPISIRYYAGQLTDPLSHFLFVCSFIFIQLDLFRFFSLTLLYGILTKETILIMPIYYVLLKINDKRSVVKGALLFIIGLLIVFFIRIMIGHHSTTLLTYKNISGVDLSHIKENLFENRSIWMSQVIYTIGILMPFYVLSWKTTRKELRKLVLFLLPMLFISNIMFSWLYEVRNLIPVFIPMAIIAADYLVVYERGIDTG